MKNPMKSSVDCFDVTVDNSAVTVSKHSIHAGCYDVSMMTRKAPMCVRVRVCAHEIIKTSKHRNKSISMRLSVLRHKKAIETCRNTVAGVL